MPQDPESQPSMQEPLKPEITIPISPTDDKSTATSTLASQAPTDVTSLPLPTTKKRRNSAEPANSSLDKSTNTKYISEIDLVKQENMTTERTDTISSETTNVTNPPDPFSSVSDNPPQNSETEDSIQTRIFTYTATVKRDTSNSRPRKSSIRRNDKFSTVMNFWSGKNNIR